MSGVDELCCGDILFLSEMTAKYKLRWEMLLSKMLQTKMILVVLYQLYLLLTFLNCLSFIHCFQGYSKLDMRRLLLMMIVVHAKSLIAVNIDLV